MNPQDISPPFFFFITNIQISTDSTPGSLDPGSLDPGSSGSVPLGLRTLRSAGTWLVVSNQAGACSDRRKMINALTVAMAVPGTRLRNYNSSPALRGRG